MARMIRSTAVGTAFTLAAAIAVCAPPAAQAASQYAFSSRNVLEPGTKLDVANVNGPIVVTHAGGREAKISATITSRRGNARAITINVSRVGRTLYVCPVFPGQSVKRDCSGRNSSFDNDNDSRVVFSIAIPRGVSVRARNVNGEISATGLDSDVDAAGVNQNVTIATSATGTAKTVNGSIDATLGARRWTGSLRFEAVNGTIWVKLPRDASFSYRAETLNGGIDVKGFGTGQTSSGFVGRKVAGTVGRGGGDLALKTLNGPIRLSAR